MKKVLVTGAAGFIGSHLCEYFLTTYPTIEVIGVDDLSAGKIEYLANALKTHPRFRLYEHTLGSGGFMDNGADALYADAKDADGAVFLAARVGVKVAIDRGVEVLIDNHEALEESLELISESRARFVYASSSEVYGDNETQPLREDMALHLPAPTNPRFCYTAQKFYAESYLCGLAKRAACNAIIARFFNTVGARQNKSYGAVLPAVVLAVLNDRVATVHKDHEGRVPTRSFIHVYDTCAAIDTLLQKGEVGQVYNVGAGEELSIHQLVGVVARVLKQRDAWPSSEVTVGEALTGCRRRVPDVSKLLALGWGPAKTLEDAIKDLAAEVICG